MENFDLEKFLVEIKDQYFYMNPDQRNDWFNGMLEKLNVSKYFNADNDKDYTPEQLIRVNAFRRSVALIKNVFVNGLSAENKQYVVESQKIWKEYNLDEGIDYVPESTNSGNS